MKPIVFIVPGEAYGKGRVRFQPGRKPFVDPRTRQYEALVKQCCEDAMRASGAEMIEGAVTLSFTIYKSMPASWRESTKARMTGEYVVTKPDLDNVAKGIKDALNGVAWKDDSQVASLHCMKTYTAGEEKVVVRIEELDL